MSKSEVWQHFELDRDQSGCKVGKCRLCSGRDKELVIKCRVNSTKGLWKHLEARHKEASDKLTKRVPASEVYGFYQKKNQVLC